ncbi:MAG TPA: HAMP domain-containing protein, partial [Elusimicrobiota bacterium]|nr:HAMP domain-containing protein [Elusimicrobiota bacterium]
MGPVKLSARLERLTVGARLGLGFGVLLGSLVCLGVFFALQARFINSSVEGLVLLQEPQADAADEMKIDLIGVRSAVLSYLESEKDSALERLAQRRADFDAAFREYLGVAPSREARALAKALNGTYEAWLQEAETMIYLKDSERREAKAYGEAMAALDRQVAEQVRGKAMQRHWSPSLTLQEAAALELAAKDVRKWLNAYRASLSSASADRARAALRDFGKHLAAYEALPLADGERRWARGLRRSFSSADDRARRLIAVIQGQVRHREAFESRWREADQIMDGGIRLPLERSRALARERIRRTLSRADALVFAFVLLVVLLGVAAAAATAKSILVPVSRLIAVTESAARGDLSGRVDIASSDELGTLGRSFNRMLEDLQHSRDELLREIEERKQAEEALRASNRELERFAYVSSHDLQEPLRKIANFTQLLERRYKGKLGGEGERILDVIVRSSLHIRSLIRDFQVYVQVGRQEARRARTDMAAALGRALASAEAGAAVESGPLPTVLADPAQMEELLRHLLSNALKFRGPAPPRVRVAAERDGDGWRFLVSDNGIGIEPRYSERIYAIFQR